MANLFPIAIPDSAAALLVTYGAGAIIRVQSSPTEAGVFGEVTTLPIITGIETYAVHDPDGISSDWYRIRYEASDGDPAGAYADAFQPMQLGGVYASLTQFEAFIRDESTADRDLKLLALEASSRAIDRTTNRRFDVAGVTATARYFTPYHKEDGRWAVRVDDLTDSTDLAVKLDTTGNGDYGTTVTTFRLGPLNAPSRGRPWTELLFDSGTAVPRRWVDSIEVTARWGWTAVPTTITNACLIQASRFFKRRDAPFGIAGSPELGSELRLLAKLDPDVAVMIGPFRSVQEHMGRSLMGRISYEMSG